MLETATMLLPQIVAEECSWGKWVYKWEKIKETMRRKKKKEKRCMKNQEGKVKWKQAVECKGREKNHEIRERPSKKCRKFAGQIKININMNDQPSLVFNNGHQGVIRAPRVLIGFNVPDQPSLNPLLPPTHGSRSPFWLSLPHLRVPVYSLAFCPAFLVGLGSAFT